MMILCYTMACGYTLFKLPDRKASQRAAVSKKTDPKIYIFGLGKSDATHLSVNKRPRSEFTRDKWRLRYQRKGVYCHSANDVSADALLVYRPIVSKVRSLVNIRVVLEVDCE
jgi:hypothetical protein